MRRLLGTVLVLALVAVGLVVGDRVARAAAERRIGVAVSTAVTVTGAADVHVQERTPFLLQLLRGRVQDVDVDLAGVQVGGLTATDVHVSARDVAVSAPHSAGHVTVDAVLPPSTVQHVLAERTGLDVAMSVDGAALKATGTVLGLELTVHLEPRVDAGRLLVDTTVVTLGGRAVPTTALPAGLRRALTGLQVPVDGLPRGLVLTGAQVVPAGVQVTLAGDDVVTGSAAATSAP